MSSSEDPHPQSTSLGRQCLAKARHLGQVLLQGLGDPEETIAPHRQGELHSPWVVSMGKLVRRCLYATMCALCMSMCSRKRIA